LAEVLKVLPPEVHPDLLVGFNKGDDSGIYRINDRQALVQTVDFFPPIVDDPYAFGQIAAANALSDVYAMGGRPLTALNIVGFPARMDRRIMQEILVGGADKIHEAGAVIVGGHSIKDDELKYGLACTGIIEIDKIMTNDKARDGDVLILTKPLGTGIISTAIKKKMASVEDAARVAGQMAELNRTAAELMMKHGAHAATDVTGFGILGHALEMADASAVSIEIEFDRLPLLPNVIKYAEAGALTPGADANREFLEGKLAVSDSLSKAQNDVLYDAQTSGGLLISLPEEKLKDLFSDSRSAGLDVWRIGRVKGKSDVSITVR
jgi:selenide,water dikinase